MSEYEDPHQFWIHEAHRYRDEMIALEREVTDLKVELCHQRDRISDLLRRNGELEADYRGWLDAGGPMLMIDLHEWKEVAERLAACVRESFDYADGKKKASPEDERRVGRAFAEALAFFDQKKKERE